MQLGPHRIEPKVILAPMAGVTDKPFRLLCKRLGAGLAVSEMTTSDPRFWTTSKSLHRMDHVGEPDPVINAVSAWGVPAALVNGVASCSLMQHFDALRRGVIDLYDVAYYVGVMVFMLAAAHAVTDNRKAS